MSKIIIFFSWLCFSLSGAAQGVGIRFESGLSWQQILVKAQTENKLIFIDCYATWCGPCKFMDQNIYPDSLVGEYFNTHFVNVKVQMDRTNKDDQNVRDWYAESDSLSKACRINSYPTLLFFSSNGNALHKIVGSSENGRELIIKAEAIEDPDKQYYTLLSAQDSHKGDSAFLLHATIATQAAGDDSSGRIFANDYLACLKQPLTKASLNLAGPYIISESDTGFKIVLNNATVINHIYAQQDFAERRLARVIYEEEIEPLFKSKSEPVFLDPAITRTIAKYPSLNKEKFCAQLRAHVDGTIGDEILRTLKVKQPRLQDTVDISMALKRRFPDHDCGKDFLYWLSRYYYGEKDWTECEKSAIILFDKYTSTITASSMNNLTWKFIFLNGSDKKILKKAIVHMKSVVDSTANSDPDAPLYIDTYANLLYKAGYRKEAMSWEEKAIEASKRKGEVDGGLVVALDRMEKQLPTWGRDE